MSLKIFLRLTLEKFGCKLIRFLSTNTITTSSNSNQLVHDSKEWANPFEIMRKKLDEIPVSRVERKKHGICLNLLM